MDRFDRIFDLHKILQRRRRPVSMALLTEELECSRATVVRTIGYLRDFLGAPLEYDRERNGYHYRQGEQPRYELPGLWFSAEELHALLAAQELLGRIQPGLLEGAVAPLRQRIRRLLVNRHAGDGELNQRVRILSMGARHTPPGVFAPVAGALVRRTRLTIRYHGRANDQWTERELSPQRLTHYRDNWYLDAWCHLREALRSFALDRIHHVCPTKARARDVPEETLDKHFATAYGIFAGTPSHQAVLRFTADCACWVADEQWHPQQQGRFLDDGCYELRLPYGDPRELIMDILKYGPGVEVVAPKLLRKAVRASLKQALDGYGSGRE